MRRRGRERGSGASLLLAVLLAAWAAGCARQDGRSDGRTCAVRRGDIAVSLRTRGTFFSRNTVRIVPGIRRQVKITWLAPAGSWIEKGDLVARLSVPRLDEDLTAKETQINKAIGRYNTNVVEYEIGKVELKNREKAARLALDTARSELERYEKGEMANRERTLLVAVEEAETRLGQARKTVARMPSLVKEGFATQDEAVRAATDETKAREGLFKARARLDLFRTYERPMQLARLRANVASRATSLAAARKRTAVRLAHRKLALEREKEHIERLVSQHRTLVEYGRKTEVKAPVAGLLVLGEPDRRRRRHVIEGMDVEVGKEMWGESILGTVPDLSAMYVSIRVPEDRIYLLRRDMAATVHTLVHDVGTLPARIEKIAEVATREGRRTGKTFEVEIRVEGLKARLKPGLTVDVEIEIDRIQDVLFVPLHAVTREGAQRFCYRVAAGRLEKSPVDVGASSEAFVEIRSGLSEGDAVFLGSPGTGQASLTQE